MRNIKKGAAGKMRNYRIDTEAGAQEAIFSWCELQSNKYPELKLLHHIPNGGQRNKATAIALKRQGVKAGVPDLMLPVARGGYHGLYIELKKEDKTNKPTVLQKQWINELQKQGYFATVCYGFDETVNTLVEYLEMVTPDKFF